MQDIQILNKPAKISKIFLLKDVKYCIFEKKLCPLVFQISFSDECHKITPKKPHFKPEKIEPNIPSVYYTGKFPLPIIYPSRDIYFIGTYSSFSEKCSDATNPPKQNHIYTLVYRLLLISNEVTECYFFLEAFWFIEYTE